MQAALQRAREQAAGQAASLTQALKKAQNDINEAKVTPASLADGHLVSALQLHAPSRPVAEINPCTIGSEMWITCRVHNAGAEQGAQGEASGSRKGGCVPQSRGGNAFPAHLARPGCCCIADRRLQPANPLAPRLTTPHPPPSQWRRCRKWRAASPKIALSKRYWSTSKDSSNLHWPARSHGPTSPKALLG